MTPQNTVSTNFLKPVPLKLLIICWFILILFELFWVGVFTIFGAIPLDAPVPPPDVFSRIIGILLIVIQIVALLAFIDLWRGRKNLLWYIKGYIVLNFLVIPIGTIMSIVTALIFRKLIQEVPMRLLPEPTQSQSTQLHKERRGPLLLLSLCSNGLKY